MALLFAEHTLTFTVVTETTNGEGEVQIPAEGASATVVGQLHSLTASAAFERFGVELRRPYCFVYDLDDEESVKMGYIATYDSREFEVAGPPIKNAAGGELASLDYMECVLEEREFI
jgi:hypothetical protein